MEGFRCFEDLPVPVIVCVCLSNRFPGRLWFPCPARGRRVLDFMKPLLYTLFLGSEYAVNPMEQREEKSCATTKEEEREWERRDGCAPTVIPPCGAGYTRA
jgi:hypothetical protein